MLFRIITNLDDEDIGQITQLVDGLDIRLNAYERVELTKLKPFFEKSSIPIMLTFCKEMDRARDESKWEEWVAQLFSLKPSFFNFEYGISLSFLQQMAALHPEVNLVCSYYSTEEIPDSISNLFSMMNSPIFSAYQVVTTALSTLDVLRMMVVVRDLTASGKKVTGICLGEKGHISSILGPIYGNFFDYLPEASCQLLNTEDLFAIYRYRILNSATRVYGLIGYSVAKSLSHFVHNAVIQALGLNAVYIKMSIAIEELEQFFLLATQLNIQGLSVTMPLKESVAAFLDKIEPMATQMQAVNTISVEEGKWLGFNTDGIGAIDAIEKQMPIQSKKVVLIGAGGAAKAIAYIAHQRGAHLTILNRTEQKAQELARHVNVRGGKLEQIAQEYDQGYDVLINCTPDPLPIDPQYILPTALVMDIKTLPSASSLLTHAKEKGSTIIYGYEMFINQAVAQINIWFKERMKGQNILNMISAEVTKHLSSGNNIIKNIQSEN